MIYFLIQYRKEKPDLEKSGLHPCYENRNVISIKDDANLKGCLIHVHDQRHPLK
jgi:hypothetical protein